MSIRTKLSAAPFAHLLGLAARAEDDDESRKGKRAEDDEDDKKSRRAEEEDDDKDDEKDKKSKKARRAEEGDDDDDDDKKSRRAEESDEDDEDEDKSKRGKRAKKADDDSDMEDDDDEDEMKGSSASAKARRRERARCAAIFSSSAAAGIPHVAANLAFNTNMSRKEAISVLQSVAAGQPKQIMAVTRSSLAERMATQSVPHVGADGGKSNPSGMSPIAAAIVAAGEKARGGK